MITSYDFKPENESFDIKKSTLETKGNKMCCYKKTESSYKSDTQLICYLLDGAGSIIAIENGMQTFTLENMPMYIVYIEEKYIKIAPIQWVNIYTKQLKLGELRDAFPFSCYYEELLVNNIDLQNLQEKVNNPDFNLECQFLISFRNLFLKN